MTTSLALGPLGQISRSVKSIEQSIDWYRNKLGLKHLYTFGKLSFFDCGGTRLFLEESAEPTSESVLYLRVPDINVAYQELQARGITFSSAPHLLHRHDDGMEEWMAFFDDLEGRPLALMCQVKPVARKGGSLPR
jgi:catechol 2,3-dioxygenase-like lactoylglutathione lyase family enzyme